MRKLILLILIKLYSISALSEWYPPTRNESLGDLPDQTLQVKPSMKNCLDIVFNRGIAYDGALVAPQHVQVSGDSRSFVVREGAQLSGPVITTSKGSVILDVTGDEVRCKSFQNAGDINDYISKSVRSLRMSLSENGTIKNKTKAAMIVQNCSGIAFLAPEVRRLKSLLPTPPTRTAPASQSTIQ